MHYGEVEQCNQDHGDPNAAIGVASRQSRAYEGGSQGHPFLLPLFTNVGMRCVLGSRRDHSRPFREPSSYAYMYMCQRGIPKPSVIIPNFGRHCVGVTMDQLPLLALPTENLRDAQVERDR